MVCRGGIDDAEHFPAQAANKKSFSQVSVARGTEGIQTSGGAMAG